MVLGSQEQAVDRYVLQIILMILKIIGTIVLVLIGALLLILAVVLIVPVRYRLSVQWKEEFHLNGTVSWLLHVFHTRISMENTEPHIRVRIFGYVIYDNEKPGRHRSFGGHKKKKDAKTAAKVAAKAGETKRPDSKKAVYEPPEEKDAVMDHTGIETRENPVDTLETPDTKFFNIERHKDKPKRETLWERVLAKIRSISSRISGFFKELADRILKLCQSFAEQKRKAGLILEFFRDELNREGFQYTFSSIKKLLKHILPTKLRASIVYGTGDPCSTGEILGVFGMLYGLYGDKLSVTPDFERQRFAGDLDAKGRIRLITILIIVIKLMLDRRFKQLRCNLKTLKEAL